MTGNDEKRQFSRHEFLEKIEFRTDDTKSVEMLNISAGGISMVSSYSIEPGTSVEVILMEGNVAVKGTVQRVIRNNNDRFEIAVEFEVDASDILEVMIEHNMN